MPRNLLGVLIAASCTATLLGQPDEAPFREVMLRVHAYVSEYEDHGLSTVLGRERYHQQLLDFEGGLKQERTLLSEYLLFQLPDEDWLGVRDVKEVDGTAETRAQDWLGTLFNGPRETLGDRARQLANKNAQYNLGSDYYRTVNLPTYALRVLRPAQRSRIAFRKAGEGLVNGTATWIVAFEETKGPTLSATQTGKDIPASGRFWIEPATGVVVRSEIILGGTRRLAQRATVTVTYRPDSVLGFWIPAEMRERYDNPRKRKADVVVAVATYSEFRPFDWRRR